MIRVGETAGVLDQVMESLSDFAQRDLDFREKIRGAATYPLFVLGLAGVSVLIIMLFILPRILSTRSSAACCRPVFWGASCSLPPWFLPSRIDASLSI